MKDAVGARCASDRTSIHKQVEQIDTHTIITVHIQTHKCMPVKYIHIQNTRRSTEYGRRHDGEVGLVDQRDQHLQKLGWPK